MHVCVTLQQRKAQAASKERQKLQQGQAEFASNKWHKLQQGKAVSQQRKAALLNFKMYSLIQEHHPYTGTLNSETSGDSENTFLHCGDIQGLIYTMKKTAPGLLSGENAYI